MPRGRLKVYLGVGPGAGTTHALLDEARRRTARGTDLVIAAVGTHGRAALVAAAAELETVGDGRQVDLPALLHRRPAVAVVDDLQQPNAPGAPHAHRWQDAEELLAAGIDVLAAVDVRYVRSLADVVESITGTRPDDGVPDSLLLAADQLQLVDIAPQALRRRLAHGVLYPAEEVGAELSAAFRAPVLAALRELALTWVAGVVPRQHAALADGDAPPSETRERVLVGLSSGPESQRLLHRAARLAARMPGAELHAVHVLPGHRLDDGPGAPDGLRELAASVGAGYQQVIGDDVATALLAVAEAEHATQLVVGADHAPGRFTQLAAGLGRPGRRPGTAARLVAGAAGTDIHVVALPDTRGRTSKMPPLRSGLPRWRLLTGLGLAVALPALLALGFGAAGAWVGLAGQSLLFLLAVVITSLAGGLWPALLSAVVGSTMLNYFFIPPVHTLRVADPHNVITLIVFVLAATLVSAVVQRAASLSGQAARASAESRSLAAMASEVLRGEEALPALLEHVRSAFGMTSASLLEQTRAGGQLGWRVVSARGTAPSSLTPEEADVTVPAGDHLVLALAGRTLAAADRTMLRAFAAQVRGLLERDRLARSAAHAARLQATERLRDALLAAVGHDLRTPLASATAAVSSLRAADVDWSPAERQELLATAEESLARLGRLVADLLDLSRLRAGVLTVGREPVWLDDVLPPALDELGRPGRDVTLRLPESLPPVLADAGLLTRALGNLAGNAVRYSPPGIPPVLTASVAGDRVEIRVIDRGPGIPEQDRDRIFVPFQRLGDTDNQSGLGLGLALSRGLVEAMEGTLDAEDTPGGGLTLVLSLPAAPSPEAVPTEPGRRERADGAT